MPFKQAYMTPFHLSHDGYYQFIVLLITPFTMVGRFNNPFADLDNNVVVQP